jgi:hypothetical protein
MNDGMNRRVGLNKQTPPNKNQSILFGKPFPIVAFITDKSDCSCMLLSQLLIKPRSQNSSSSGTSSSATLGGSVALGTALSIESSSSNTEYTWCNNKIFIY